MEGQTTQSGKRPTFLTVLVILVYIGAGLGILGLLIGLVAVGVAGSLFSKIPGMGGLVGGGIGYTAVLLVLSTGRLIGAIQMWKLKKMGFYIYTACVVLGIIAPYIFLPMATFSFVGLIIPAAFVICFALNLKAMN